MVKQSHSHRCAARAGSSVENHPLQGRKILFVDDDRAVRSVFRRAFRYTGAEIHVAADPRQAIHMATLHDYSVILTDLQMPGMTGLDLVEILYQRDPTTAFILVTGVLELNLPTNRPSARAISSMVRKPWLAEEIDVALVQALDLHDRRRELADTSSKDLERMTVLIVKNVDDSSNQVAQLLRQHDRMCIDVQRVTRLSAGMQLLRSNAYDIILADLSLPDARGLDAVAGLKRAAPGVPIVVMSQAHDEELAIQAVKAGAQDYLVKGEVTEKSLLRTLRYAIERKNTEEHVLYLQHHDHLSGLANRELFSRRASIAISQALHRHAKPAILLLDLDHFKHTNDALGHSIGDLLLKEVACRLRTCAEDEDALARLGGDEFAILVEESQPEGITALAERMLGALQPVFLIKGHSISITASVGITVFPENGDNIEQLLANADAAMYRAKEAGRNRYQFFDQDMHAKALRWINLERELRGALERDEFSLHYQPQVDCKSGQVVSFEALLRWNHHSMGAVGPFEFIPILEAIGLIDKVGAWVTQEACRQLAVWRERAPKLRMAVNVSAIQFEDPTLVATVMAALETVNLPGDALELEITESLLMKDVELTLATLNALSARGIRIAIDDFGTGYSNLSNLARFPIDQLKVDKSIIDILGTPPGDAIARAVVELSRALEIEILAEGVESAAQLGFLQAMQVEYYQGYFFSKPQTAPALEAFLDLLPNRAAV